MSPTVIILSRNHFDNLWRRCWDRAYEHRGRLYASYVTVEAAVLDEMLRIAAADAHYSLEVESSLLLRRYLDDHPGALPLLKRLWEAGRFCLLGSGEVIPDANMPRGETIVRNLAEGIWWCEETFARRPRVGWHADGFGSCAQLPQIFAGCGIRWIAALSYRFPSRQYWRGLDGTVAYIGKPPNRNVVDYVKYPPCPACAGRGCDACGGYGLHFVRRLRAGAWIDDLTGPLATLTFFGEEVLPPEDLPAAVAAHDSDVKYRFGTHETVLERIGEKLAACDDPPAEAVSPEPDGNPTTSGALVSRIELKRRHRQAESAVVAAEAWSALTGRGAARLRDLWRDLFLGAFHDALPGTHIDPAHEDLLALYDRLQGGCAEILTSARQRGAGPCLFNPTARAGGVREVRPLVPLPEGDLAVQIGCLARPVIERARSPDGAEVLWVPVPPDVPPASATPVHICPATVESEEIQGQTVRCSAGALGLQADARGIVEISFAGRSVLRRGQWGVGEPIVEKDVGDPWATRDLDRPRRGTLGTARRVSARRTESFVELTYAGSDPAAEPKYTAADPMVLHLNWTQRWRFYTLEPWEHPYVDLRTEIDWSAYHRRVRLAFPTPWPTDELWTEVPFGVLRRARYEMTDTGWNNAGGDWPVVGWGSVEHDGMGLAVLNRGTPSYRCEHGLLLVSVLRSPAFPNCLEEPQSYSAPDYDGMRDAGVHVFEHRILPYRGPWQEVRIGPHPGLSEGAGIVELAQAFNEPLWLTSGAGMGKTGRFDPFVTGLAGLPAGVCVSAVKPARTGGGMVIRLVEMQGRARRFALRRLGGPWKQAWRTNLLEDVQGELSVRDSGSVELEMRPWEIATVLLRR